MKAAIYAPDEYAHRRMLASGSGSYAQFQAEAAAAAATGKPLLPERIGSFEHYPNRYWVARSGPWTARPGDPFTLYCYETSPSDLYCRTTHAFDERAQVTYDFRSSAAQVEATAAAVDAKFLKVLSDLAAEK